MAFRGGSDSGEESGESVLSGFDLDEKRRSFLRQVGAGAAVAGVGGVTLASETVEAASGDEFQVDLVQGTSLKDSLDGATYSDDGRLINWKWGDVDGNTAEGSMDKEPFDPGNSCSVSTNGITIDTLNDFASVEVDPGCGGGDTVTVMLVCYSGPFNSSQLGWNPAEAGQQQVWDFATATGNDTTQTLSIDTPPNASWSFENPNPLYDWVITQSGFEQKSGGSIGPSSGGINETFGSDVLRIANTNLPGDGGGQIDTFSFSWKEQSGSTGGGLRLKNSAGEYEAGFASANPEWNVTDGSGGGTTEVYDGSSSSTSDYDKWVRVEYTFNWGAGTYDYDIQEDSGNQVQRTGTENLTNGRDIAEIQIHNYNVGFNTGGDMVMRFDNMFAEGVDINVARRYDFEDGLGDWNAVDGNFTQKTNRSYTGSASAGIEADSTGSPVADLTSIPPGVLDGNVDVVSFLFNESTNSTGGGLRMKNSNGNFEASFATDNPQWFFEDADGVTKVYDGDGVDRWVFVKLEPDFGANTYDWFIEDLSSGTTRSGTRNLKNGVDVETLEIQNFNLGDGSFAASDGMYMWFDDIRVS